MVDAARELLIGVRLGNGVTLTAELLGAVSSLPTGRLVLPSLDDDDEEVPELQGLSVKGFEHNLTKVLEDGPWSREDTFWGRVFKRDAAGDVMSAVVYHGIVSLEFPAAGATVENRVEAGHLGAQLNSEIKLLLQWLEVCSGQPLQSGPPDYFNEPSNVSFYGVVMGSNSQPSLAQLEHMGHIVLRSEISLDVWQSALAYVNRNAVPPPAHLFLRDSQAALLQDDYRQSVIDASTAAEVALSYACRQQLAPAFPDSVESVLKNAAGVVGLFDLALALGVPTVVSRGRVCDQLAGPRNSAVHRGESMKEEVARAAVGTATQLVRDVAPLEEVEADV